MEEEHQTTQITQPEQPEQQQEEEIEEVVPMEQEKKEEEKEEEISEEQMKIYNKVKTVITEKKYLEVEDALEELFLSEYSANGKQMGEILQLLVDHKHRIYEVFGYSTFHLAVLHSMHQFQWRENVEIILKEVYEKMDPKEMFLFQKNIVKTTQDIPTLLHSLKFVPQVYKNIPSQKKLKTLVELKEQIISNMDVINTAEEKGNMTDVIVEILTELIPHLPNHVDSLILVLKLMEDRAIHGEIIGQVGKLARSLKNFPNIFLSFTPQQLLTYVGVGLAVPLILNQRKVFEMIENAILEHQLFNFYSLGILQRLVQCQQNDIHPDVIYAVFNGITMIKTDGIETQRNIASLFKRFVFSQTAESFNRMIQTIFSSNKYEKMYNYGLTLIKDVILFREKGEQLPCLSQPEKIYCQLDELIRKFLAHPLYHSLDKFSWASQIDDLVEVVRFFQFVVIKKIDGISIKEHYNKLNEIYAQLLKVRTVTMKGPTKTDVEDLKKMTKMCNFSVENKQLHLSQQDQFERQTSKLEFGLYILQSVTNYLKQFIE